ncbi:unnamed protein product [Rotaria magnacalcarata]|uniref:Uncharacterized protein n=1 Tax=Rotaria magnacalcarata TaxID=392030 RepID=A0A819FLS4_9BILA|nr:unnamed protein product [Rotaria magnacalcarata]
MSNETIQGTTRVKCLAEAHIKSKLVNNKLRRLCSVDNCKKLAQRKYLCAKHLTENKRQPAIQTITTFHQPSASLSTENSRNMFYNPTNAVSSQYHDVVLNTIDEFDDDHRKPMLSHPIGQNIGVISTNESSECTYDNIKSIDQVGIGRSSISVTVPGTSTDAFCETALNNNTTIDMKTCEYRFLPENGDRCYNRATYQCTHCSSTFCLKHGSQHQQTVKEELQCLLEEAKQLYAKLSSLNINSGREHCLNQFKSWMKIIQDKINQQYKEFQMEVDRLHVLANFNREHLIRSLANHMEIKVGHVVMEQLQKDEIDELEINRARNEFVHIQQLFDILCNQPLISINNGVGNEFILNAPRATLRNLNVDGFNWIEEISTKNPFPRIDFSDQNQAHVEETIMHQSTNELPPPPRSQNPTLEKIIGDHHGRDDLSLRSMKLTNADMEIVAYYGILRNMTLTTLDLSYNDIGEDGAQYLANALATNKVTLNQPLCVEYIVNLFLKQTLTTLDLTGNNIGEDGAEHLANALATNKVTLNQPLCVEYIVNLFLNQTLTTLDLTYNDIGEDGAAHLANALTTNKVTLNQSLCVEYIANLFLKQTLTTLDLSCNDIGEDGAEHLANALATNKVTLNQSLCVEYIVNLFLKQTLTRLELVSKDIGPDIAQRIADGVRKNQLRKS